MTVARDALDQVSEEPSEVLDPFVQDISPSSDSILIHLTCGKEETEFRVERSRNVAYLKQQNAKKGGDIFDQSDQELTCEGETLDDQLLIDEFCKKEDAMIHLVIQKSAKGRAKPVRKGFTVSIEAVNLSENVNGESVPPYCRSVLLEAYSSIELPEATRQLIMSTFDGLKSLHRAFRPNEGSAGVYFMYDSIGREFVSVFKPSDEEPVAVNNPHRLRLSKDGEGLKRGTQVGEGAIREVAAYLLDHPSSAARYSKREGEGFTGVPLTTMVKLHERFNHPSDYKESVKIGSLQMYIKNRGTCEGIDSSDFPVREVHKISILDIRLANVDRHAGNILMTTDDEDRIVLVPVDHGNCLPKNFEQCFFVWLDWPQAKQPYSPDMIEYIKTLDAEEDIKLLKQHGWDVPDECVRVLRVSTMLLKKGAARGLTPSDIGSILCRKFLHKESVIEQIIQEAKKDSLPESTEAAFLEAVSSFMDRHLSEVS